MTEETRVLLDELAGEEFFKPVEGRTKIYFAGGTALAYYLDHRISYDLDFICTGKLPAQALASFAMKKGWRKHVHPHESTFRIQRGEPLDNFVQTYYTSENIKVEFFFAENAIQQNIFASSSPQPYKTGGVLHILDLFSIVKLKIFALLNREKSRDMFDAAIMLERNLTTIADIQKMVEYHPQISVPAKLHLERYNLKEDESLDFRKDQEHYRVFARLKTQEKRAELAKQMVFGFFRADEEEALKNARQAGRGARRDKK